MAARELEDEAPARAQPRAQRLVWLLTACVAVAAAALIVPLMRRDPSAAVLTSSGWLLVPLFALAEVVVIHLPTQRNSHAHTLREVPAAIGLAFLAPQEYVLVYVLGAVAALLVHVRMRGVKLAFNTALYAFEAGLGVVVYHAVLQQGDPASPLGWLAALLAVLATDLISASAVTAAISVTESRFDGGVLSEALRWGVPAACINTCVALLVVTLILVRPFALVLLGTILVLVVLGYRAYVGLARKHARTRLLYQFVDRTSAAHDLDEVVSVALRETKALMNAQSAYLLELLGVDPSPGACWHLLVEDTLTSRAEPGTMRDTWWQPALEGRSVVLSRRPRRGPDTSEPTTSRAEPSREVAAPLDPREAIAVPLRARDRIRGVLMVCDRAFEEESFDAEDLEVLVTMAAHTTVALERADTVASLQLLAEERANDALHDPLSGLPNRRAFTAAVADALSGGSAGVGGDGVVLLLDIDDFRDVNDTLGHSAGDQLLSMAGARIRTSAGGLVARLGGDEFAVLLPGLTVEQGLDYARELRETLSQPVPLGDVTLLVSASVGIAVFKAGEPSADQLMAHADVAMYTAKANRSGVAVYHPEVGDRTARRLTLAADLPTALAREEIQLWYQPQADATSGAVSGFEALMRWRHPAFGLVPPPEVVAIAQRTGHMRRLTDDLIRQALSARRRWSEAGHDLVVSVNVTPRDVADPALVEQVTSELARTDTPPCGLTLEITESDVMKDPVGSLGVLAMITALGVTLSIDDFGTGYSSLSYLDRLPVNEVKIDRSFVARLEGKAANPTIVSATISLAHDLNLRVVAEGVETERAGEVLRDLGADTVQGYGLARPMPGEEVLDWLERHLARAAADVWRGGAPHTDSPHAP